MLSDAQYPAANLNPHECWKLLAGTTEGRLAVSVHNKPDIFPVEFHAENGKILVRTPQGKMLVELTINPSVAFEANGRSETSAWTVVVQGTARELQNWSEIDTAEQKAQRLWTPTAKGSFVEIVPTGITGRRRPICAQEYAQE
ncbi:pyridoxamine 5'-phosphate oxidase family protein [Burkholderia sp. RS01]|uniref:pyridoxamine 5'-phosphate oxidase family protein n=1 Tax=unclassified Burkholderia TaxID=2613784 RepID=UPI003218526B